MKTNGCLELAVAGDCSWWRYCHREAGTCCSTAAVLQHVKRKLEVFRLYKQVGGGSNYDAASKTVLTALCSALPYPTISYPTLSYPTISQHTLFYPILSYLIPSYPTLSHLILSYPILHQPILSYRILSYHTLPYPTLSYPTPP